MAANAQVVLILFRQGSGFSQLDSVVAAREYLQTAIARMRQAGYEPVSSFNPFWDEHGLTFEDPDGYRVVLQHASWNYS